MPTLIFDTTLKIILSTGENQMFLSFLISIKKNMISVSQI